MPIPRRQGLEAGDWQRRVAPHERTRARAVQRAAVRDDLGGAGAIWYRTAAGVAPYRLGILPGVADDLPSLLSTLSVEVAWPGAPPPAAASMPPDRAVAVWIRVWQVRDGGDLRVFLYWDAGEAFHAAVELETPGETPRPVLDGPGTIALLDRVAVRPQASESPHGLLLAGNRSMETGGFATARALYERAARDLPRHPEVHRNLALALARLDEWEAAAACMRNARALAPADLALEQDFLALETDAGIHAVEAGKSEQAAAHFLRILQQWPDEPTALVNLGNLRLREGRVPEARAIFRRFLRLHPGHAAAAKVRLALQQLGETD